MFAVGTPLRAAPAPLLLLALSYGCWRVFADDRAALVHHPGQSSLSALITGLAALALQAALAWLDLLAALVLLEPWSGRELTAYAGCPPSLRRILLAGCGAAVVSVLAAPANAAPSDGNVGILAAAAGHDDHTASVLDGLGLPERTLGRIRSPGVPASARGVVVRSGDTLWSIAAARLPAGAGPAAIDRTWRAIYAANRSLIGPDPSLIRPGMRLDTTAPTHQEDR